MKPTRLIVPIVTLLLLAACNLTPAPGPASTVPATRTAAPQGGSPAPTANAATPTPSLPALTRLTDPGCCAEPGWSADSTLVTFVDKPSDTAQAGIYGVSVDGGPEQLVSQQVGLLSADGKLLAYLDGKNDTILRHMDGSGDTPIDNHGGRPVISPGDKRLAWVFASQIDVVIGTRVDIVVADIDGNNQNQLLTVYNGGVAGWLDDDHLLVAGRKSAAPGDIVLFSLDVMSGAQVDLVSETRIRNISVAPGGRWISYAVTFDTKQPPDDGLWVISADGSSKTKLPIAGGAQWRGDHRLLVIPLDMGAPSHRLWQLDARTGEGGDLTDPAATSFRVEGGQWSVSPDGSMMVFMNETDHALWLMRLPG